MNSALTELVERFSGPAPDAVDDDPRQSRRRRIVVAVFLIAGAVILGFSLTAQPGDSSFYPLTAALAVTWIVGGLASGPIRLGHFALRGTRTASDAAVFGVLTGAAVGLVFIVGALITREIPALSDLVNKVLAFSDQGSIIVITVITLGNGLAEEVFFRGAVYSAAQHHRPVVVSTILYVIATLASGNPMLGFAAIILGAVCALLRRSTDGVLAPICCHVVWGAIVLFGLPPLFA